jgi:hypothetical protein
MTGITLRVGLNMLRMLTRRTDTIMTTGTDPIGLDIGMTETDGIPVGAGGMTNITGLIRDDVSIGFSRRLYTVVATGTGASHDTTVIKSYLPPFAG